MLRAGQGGGASARLIASLAGLRAAQAQLSSATQRHEELCTAWRQSQLRFVEEQGRLTEAEAELWQHREHAREQSGGGGAGQQSGGTGEADRQGADWKQCEAKALEEVSEARLALEEEQGGPLSAFQQADIRALLEERQHRILNDPQSDSLEESAAAEGQAPGALLWQRATALLPSSAGGQRYLAALKGHVAIMFGWHANQPI